MRTDPYYISVTTQKWGGDASHNLTTSLTYGTFMRKNRMLEKKQKKYIPNQSIIELFHNTH
jgi:hypothetical protein